MLAKITGTELHFDGKTVTQGGVPYTLPVNGAVRVEALPKHPDVKKIIVLDAEDTLDVIVETADGKRECVYSIVQEVEL